MKLVKPFLALLVVSLASSVFAVEPVNKSRQGVSIEGYDPVAYFVVGRPVKGNPQFRTEWNGATWWFSSEANRDKFVADPEAFAPRYGGFCAKAVSEGQTASIDPEAWEIVDGKLYLNYSLKVRDLWRKDRDDRIRRADENWPKLLAK